MGLTPLSTQTSAAPTGNGSSVWPYVAVPVAIATVGIGIGVWQLTKSSSKNKNDSSKNTQITNTTAPAAAPPAQSDRIELSQATKRPAQILNVPGPGPSLIPNPNLPSDVVADNVQPVAANGATADVQLPVHPSPQPPQLTEFEASVKLSELCDQYLAEKARLQSVEPHLQLLSRELQTLSNQVQQREREISPLQLRLNSGNNADPDGALQAEIEEKNNSLASLKNGFTQFRLTTPEYGLTLLDLLKNVESTLTASIAYPFLTEKLFKKPAVPASDPSPYRFDDEKLLNPKSWQIWDIAKSLPFDSSENRRESWNKISTLLHENNFTPNNTMLGENSSNYPGGWQYRDQNMSNRIINFDNFKSSLDHAIKIKNALDEHLNEMPQLHAPIGRA
jgi:hypothetical protein